MHMYVCNVKIVCKHTQKCIHELDFAIHNDEKRSLATGLREDGKPTSRGRIHGIAATSLQAANHDGTEVKQGLLQAKTVDLPNPYNHVPIPTSSPTT